MQILLILHTSSLEVYIPKTEEHEFDVTFQEVWVFPIYGAEIHYFLSASKNSKMENKESSNISQ